jgi:anti-sigma-K factor RskA
MVEELHDLTAAYALDALGADEARAYEAHLRGCTRCQQELVSLSEAANALAYAVDGPQPPPDLRARILDAARKERQNVIPFRRRAFASFAWPVAAAAATVAIAVGAWAATLASDLQAERSARAERERALAVLGEVDAERIPVGGRDGALVVRANGEAVLVAALDPPPEGKIYEAWVIVDGKPLPAGVFDVSGRTAVHVLTRPVPDGAVVAVTVEPDGGVDRPTGRPVLQTGRA